MERRKDIWTVTGLISDRCRDNAPGYVETVINMIGEGHANKVVKVFCDKGKENSGEVSRAAFASANATREARVQSVL